MCLTAYEKSVLTSFYEYNQIPLWVFDDRHQPEFCNFSFQYRSIIEAASSGILPADLSGLPNYKIITLNKIELYYYFSFIRNEKPYYLLAGPVLLVRPQGAMRFLSFSGEMKLKELEELIQVLPVVSFSAFSSGMRLMMLFFNKEAPSLEEIYQGSAVLRLHTPAEQTITEELLKNREEYRNHSPYRQELMLMNCIKEGDSEKLKFLIRTAKPSKIGHLSDNLLKQHLYECICTVTLVTRYSIEGGLDEETAYSLSDAYIRRMDVCRSISELHIINEQMALDFTEQVAKRKSVTQSACSEPISACIDYISRNINERITLKLLAEKANLTQKYLSFLFHKETGQTLNSYLLNKRIGEAKKLLVFSDYSLARISNYLAFNSQSHFIAVFRKNTTMTPGEYRKRYYNSFWEVG